MKKDILAIHLKKERKLFKSVRAKLVADLTFQEIKDLLKKTPVMGKKYNYALEKDV
jgi:hypothetical protein